MVGFLSQIGWTKEGTNSPDKKIQMYKIFIIVDEGNTLASRLHNKMPHRNCIMDQVYLYLNE